jgi:hypothetical protein
MHIPTLFQPEDVSASYAATLKYLKKHSTLPAPEVFACASKSNPGNKVNATYVPMERVSGNQLTTSVEAGTFWKDRKNLVLAKKVHQQLADVILQLGVLNFLSFFLLSLFYICCQTRRESP